jgi:hypothetical protein
MKKIIHYWQYFNFEKLIMKQLFKSTLFKTVAGIALGAVLFAAFGNSASFLFGITISFVASFILARNAEIVSASLLNTLVWIDAEGNFKKMKAEEVSKLEKSEMLKYKDAEVEYYESRIEELEKSDQDNAKTIAELERQITLINNSTHKDLRDAMKAQEKEIAELKKKGISKDSPKFKDALRKKWDENITKFSEANKAKSSHEVIIQKATQTYGDITEGSDFAQFRPGVVDIPVRMPMFRQLFSTIPVNTEFLKYSEQQTVDRNAQNVAKCAAVTSTTKETLIVRSIETKIIKDMIDFCRHFVSDYRFMQSRIQRLLNQSLALKIDQQIFLGTGADEETFSIDSTASEFSAVNPVCDISASIQDPTLVDLLIGMDTQIYELGQQNAYNPNVAVVNRCDWFTMVQSRKDLNNNYIDARISIVNGIPFINGTLMVMWSPLVPQNQCYVMDTTRGEIVDREQLVLETSFENKDNWEKEIGTLKGYERLNFLVPNNWANAFMKCGDVETALTAIEKV